MLNFSFLQFSNILVSYMNFVPIIEFFKIRFISKLGFLISSVINKLT